ncbi:MAG: nitroimidazol reductase NimA-like FMN-containing flavoprotein [Halioglobus sp.]|jgi:nitroimidazol reductase NimA-like FMN-containing flavoprotein (pyridoxamine 5'-phosphate oxidase superfamily)
MKIHPNSAWSKDTIFEYLDNANTPLRISCTGSDGYPIICSLWYIHQDGVLWSASHKNSHMVKTLRKDPKIGFEVATNEYPYHGVRGKANITLLEDSAEDILEKVIGKYLRGSNKNLSDWLMSRKADEYAIKISPITLNSWDFSARMVR